MSVAVGLEQLRDEIERHVVAPYLLTVTPDGRPHAVAVDVRWDGDQLVVAAGSKTAANAAARPAVSLLWPPTEPGGYTLIVDGTASAAPAGAGLAIRPATAVLHRPRAGPPEAGACGSDCVPVLD